MHLPAISLALTRAPLFPRHPLSFIRAQARVFGTVNAESDDDATHISRPRLYSHQVATRWYRAPELLYGARKYDERVDMWAVGCIMAEMFNTSPLFPGENDIDQLACVFRVMGTPTASSWPTVTELPDYNKITFENMAAVPLEKVVANATASALPLLKRLVVLNPTGRLDAHDALLHEYFFSEPLQAHHSELPTPAPKSTDDSASVSGHFRGFKCKPLVDTALLPI